MALSRGVGILMSASGLAGGVTWRLPAEWSPQESVFLVWPRDETTWPGGRIEGARAAILEAIRHIAAHQSVDLVVHPDLEAGARTAVGDALEPPARARVRFWPVEHVDSWIRDYGPLTVVAEDGHRKALDFRFDAWGGKYETLLADDGVTGRLAEAGALGDPLETLDFVLEGGALETDGQGTFLATESVVAARGQTKKAFERVLHDHLGAAKVLWLEEGVQGDDTDGHIDTLTRFVGPRRVVTAVQPDMEHPDHRPLLVNLERLLGMTDALGRSLEVLQLPQPEPVHTDDGAPLPAGHANFLVTDGCVLMPAYGSTSDEAATMVLRQCFPDREVVPIDHRDLIWGYGGIHCLSMQVPASKAER